MKYIVSYNKNMKFFVKYIIKEFDITINTDFQTEI